MVDARQAAEVMREADEIAIAKQIATVRECEPTEAQVDTCIWSHDHLDGEHCICLAAARAVLVEMTRRRAIPLPDATPDPRDATVARLSAELAEANDWTGSVRQACRDATGGNATFIDDDVARAIYWLSTELATMTHDRDAYKALFRPSERAAQLATDRNVMLFAQLEAAREALAPFIKHYDDWMDKYPDDQSSSVFSKHTFGELRRARAVLAEMAVKKGE